MKNPKILTIVIIKYTNSKNKISNLKRRNVKVHQENVLYKNRIKIV